MGDISTERSMEDILSSIKRIIAEEGDIVQRPTRRPRSAAVAAPDNDDGEETVLELADYADDAENEPESEPSPEREAEPRRPSAKAAESAVDAADDRPSGNGNDAILSDRAAQATRGSLEALSRLIVRPATTGSDTLEGMVRDMLRPMLSDWLDAHLPEIVERIVQREVERLTQR